MTVAYSDNLMYNSRVDSSTERRGGGREFNFTADGDPVYIKTNGKCSLSIL